MRKKIKLGDVLDVKRGMSLSGDYYSSSGKYIRLTLGNFTYPECGWKDNTSKDDLYFIGPVKEECILKKGDIITPLTEQVRGLLGNTATIPESDKYIQSGDVGLIIPKPGVVDKRFAYYLVSSPVVKKQLDAGSQQTKIRHTSPDAIKNCFGFMPEDINEQIRIAHFLDSINEKVILNKRINKTLHDMAFDVFVHFFAKKEPNGMIGDIILENQKSRIQVNEVKGKIGRYPFFTSGDDVLSINEYSVDGFNVYMNTGGNPDIKFFEGKAAYSTDTWSIYAKKNMSYYLYLLLIFIKKEMQIKYFQGTGLKHLQKDLLKSRPIYIPNDSEIEIFNKIVSPSLRLISDNQIEIDKLRTIENFVSPMLINGQVSVYNCL